ncbi:MAG: NeuD/PglB/VioB family sugar acetyltransferase [Phycisphaerales bacterium JB059]
MTDPTPTDRREVLIVGGGGHARVVIEAATLAGLRPVGVLDDCETPVACASPGAPPRVGPLGELSERAQRGESFVIAIGALWLRRQIIDQLARDEVDEQAASGVIHPRAIVSPEASIGAGVFVGPGSVVNPGAHVGAHAILNSGCIVEHDAQIEANAHIAPGAVLGGGARIGQDALIGIGARVLPGLRVGSGSVVGGGGVVVREVPVGRRVVGVPASACEHV